MKPQHYTLVIAFLVFCNSLQAQTNALTPASSTNTSTNAVVEIRPNPAIIPLQRTGSAVKRTELVLKRAKEAPGKCDLLFLGDSITEMWERNGTNIWKKYYGKRKAINTGVGGDRTQHVLWRLENGQVDGLQPKVTIIMIGTNNSNRDDNTEAEILEGVKAIVQQVRTRLPKTKILLLGIFPRGATFSVQRGKILQVNQALAKLADNKTIFYLDFGSQLIEVDGSISKDIMPDKLHLSERGYEIWASAMEPLLKKLL